MYLSPFVLSIPLVNKHWNENCENETNKEYINCWEASDDKCYFIIDHTHWSHIFAVLWDVHIFDDVVDCPNAVWAIVENVDALRLVCKIKRISVSIFDESDQSPQKSRDQNPDHQVTQNSIWVHIAGAISNDLVLLVTIKVALVKLKFVWRLEYELRNSEVNKTYDQVKYRLYILVLAVIFLDWLSFFWDLCVNFFEATILLWESSPNLVCFLVI